MSSAKGGDKRGRVPSGKGGLLQVVLGLVREAVPQVHGCRDRLISSVSPMGVWAGRRTVEAAGDGLLHELGRVKGVEAGVGHAGSAVRAVVIVCGKSRQRGTFPRLCLSPWPPPPPRPPTSACSSPAAQDSSAAPSSTSCGTTSVPMRSGSSPPPRRATCGARPPPIAVEQSPQLSNLAPLRLFCAACL